MTIEFISPNYDERARDGTWCKLPYPGHLKGCPNYPECIDNRLDFKHFGAQYDWHVVTETFDLASHVSKMKNKHPNWSNSQARCLLYWQTGVRSRLKKKAEALKESLHAQMILDIPEAHGINVFKMMSRLGISLKANPDLVTKVMLVGKRRLN